MQESHQTRRRRLVSHRQSYVIIFICLFLLLTVPLFFRFPSFHPSNDRQQIFRAKAGSDDFLQTNEFEDMKLHKEKKPDRSKKKDVETNESKKKKKTTVDVKEDKAEKKKPKKMNKTLTDLREKDVETIDLKKLKFCSSTRHVHLSLFGEGGMTISFASGKCGNGRGAIIYGTSRDKMDRIAYADDVRQYRAYHEKHDFYESDHHHHVILSDLEPSTEYYYTCVIIPNKAESDRVLKEKRKDNTIIYSFESEPRLGEGYGMTMAIFGDVAVRPHSKECMSALGKETDIDLLLLVGDLAYAEGVHYVWDEFMDMLDFTHRTPLLVAAGNHDIEANTTTGEMFQAYEARFRMPHIQPAEMGIFTPEMKQHDKTGDLPYLYGNSFYSFAYGPSHNIVLNSFAPFAPGTIQYKWLEKELIKVDRSVTPWLTVTLHCPLYNTFKNHRNDPQLINAKIQLEPLFVEHRVNFVFAGHVHSYSRSHPVVFDKVNATGPIHILLGNSGRQANVPFHQENPEEWILVRDHTQYGYGLLNFINATTAMYEWVVTGFNEGKRDRKSKFYYPHDEDIIDQGYVQNQFFL